MSNRITRKFKQLIAFVLVVTMITPSTAFAAEATLSATEHAWRNLPEIAPHNFDMSRFPEAANSQALEYLSSYHNELPPEVLAELLREREEYYSLDWQIRESFALIELFDSDIRFSALEEDERNMIFRRLDLAYEALEIVTLLFVRMEQDGFSLYDSVEIMRIMATGLFNYQEAQIILRDIPDSTERMMELHRFEVFVQRFDIEPLVNNLRLTNRLFESSLIRVPEEAAEHAEDSIQGINTFDHGRTWDVSAFLSSREIDTEYSFIDIAQQGVEGIYTYQIVWPELPVGERPELQPPPIPENQLPQPEKEDLEDKYEDNSPDVDEDYLPEESEEQVPYDNNMEYYQASNDNDNGYNENNTNLLTYEQLVVNSSQSQQTGTQDGIGFMSFAEASHNQSNNGHFSTMQHSPQQNSNMLSPAELILLSLLDVEHVQNDDYSYSNQFQLPQYDEYIGQSEYSENFEHENDESNS